MESIWPLTWSLLWGFQTWMKGSSRFLDITVTAAPLTSHRWTEVTGGSPVPAEGLTVLRYSVSSHHDGAASCDTVVCPRICLPKHLMTPTPRHPGRAGWCRFPGFVECCHICSAWPEVSSIKRMGWRRGRTWCWCSLTGANHSARLDCCPLGVISQILGWLWGWWPSLMLHGSPVPPSPDTSNLSAACI